MGTLSHSRRRDILSDNRDISCLIIDQQTADMHIRSYYSLGSGEDPESDEFQSRIRRLASSEK